MEDMVSSLPKPIDLTPDQNSIQRIEPGNVSVEWDHISIPVAVGLTNMSFCGNQHLWQKEGGGRLGQREKTTNCNQAPETPHRSSVA